ncbi:MAG: 1-phosphofructokinase family hexose kinase [Chloroflexota bacterium]|jgi:1-phosphofructokinase family hexose kinase|nr:1-phosphofructokinase family hexose kinase [Chloroflexota bacterium]
MIYTLTPNPSIDRSITIPEIRFNSVLRSQKVRLDWGGKGFNVSRSLKLFGIDSTALAWVGGSSGKFLSDGLQKCGIQTDFVWVDEETRTNTMIIEEEGDWHIKVNEPGPPIASADIEQLYKKVEGYAKKGDLWVLSGSLPPDVPKDFYATLINLIKSRGARVYLDASGDALRLGCQAEPHLVKPNLPEASQIVEFTIDNEEDAKRAALPFLRMGVGYFALTMGSTGLFVASQQEMVYAKPPKVHVRNAAGSGDALMAGIIYGQYQGWTLLDVARWAVATGTASVETEGVSEFEIDRIKEMLPEVEARVSNVM